MSNFPLSSSLSPQSLFTESLSESLLVTQQLLNELYQAAQEGMVATRSHDNVLQGVDANNQSTNTPAKTRSKKRKIGDENESTPDEIASKKSWSTSKAVAVVVVNPNTKENQAQDPEPELETKEHSEILTCDAIKPDEPSSQKSELYGASHESEGSVSAGDESVDRPPASGGAARQKEGRSKLSPDGADAIRAAASDAQSRKSRKLEDETTYSPSTTLPKTAKSSHQKFADTDLEALKARARASTAHVSPVRFNAEEDKENSGDDAPDIVATSAGFDQARRAKAKAKKFHENYDAARRAKRREHDERMKTQSKSEKEVGVTEDESITNELDHRAESKQAMRRDPTKITLPVTLPEEILMADLTAQPPTPPFLTKRSEAPKKKLILDSGPKPRKDIVHGNTKLRFLQKHNSILPPKSSASSKCVRETWLTGQRGLNPERGVPRRKPGGGFVRR